MSVAPRIDDDDEMILCKTLTNYAKGDLNHGAFGISKLSFEGFGELYRFILI